MGEKVFFFDYAGDTRKVTCGENEIETIESLVLMVEALYSDVEICTEDVKLWMKDQTYQIRHKLENTKEIYSGAVLEVTLGSKQKRKRKEEKQHVVSKRHRVEGPRFVARIIGLPWKATQKQIRNFFEGINLVRVLILNKPDGRPSGNALVEFQSEEDLEKGILKDKQNLGERYLDVKKSTGEQMDRARGLSDPNEIMDTKNRVIRMKGLPYSATEQDILDFFKLGNLNPAKVHIISDVATGRKTGMAFAEFESEDQIADALKLHKKEIGERWIEVYRAYMGDLKEALGMPSSEVSLAVGVSGTGGERGDACIRMIGLPWDTKDIDIVRFFKEAEVTPVRIHCKADGSEAIVEFRSADVSQAMSRNKCYMGHRYVELSTVGWREVDAIIGGLRQASYRRF